MMTGVLTAAVAVVFLWRVTRRLRTHGFTPVLNAGFWRNFP